MVRLVEPLMEPEVAWIVVLPVATPAARPALVIVATAVFAEAHVAELVRFWVLASLYVPVAVNCCVAPTAIEALAGVTATDTKAGAVTVNPVEPPIPPKVA